MAPTVGTDGISLIVSEDRLQAFIEISPHADLASLDHTALEVICQSNSVTLTEDTLANIRSLVEKVKEGHIPDAPVLIAQGQPAVEGQDGTFTIDESIGARGKSDGEGHEALDRLSKSQIILVQTGETVGQITAPVAGQNGTDVCGIAVPPTTEVQPVTLGANVKLDDGESAVTAESDGLLLCDVSSVRVEPIEQHDGDVTIEKPVAASQQALVISGNVEDNTTITNDHSICIQGSVGNAQIESRADVIVQRGIGGKEEGKVTAEGDIVCRFCGEVELSSKNNIYVAIEAMHSNIFVRGQFYAPEAIIIGGRVHARGSLEVSEIGNDSGAETTVLIGNDPNLKDQIEAMNDEIRKKESGAKRVHDLIDPWLANIKQLNVKQKEQAMELSLKLATIEGEIEQLRNKVKQTTEDSRLDQDPFLQFKNKLHAGTKILYESIEYAVEQTVEGPAKIVGQKKRLVLVKEGSDNSTLATFK